MNYTEGKITNSCNRRIHYRRWLPSNSCKADIIVAHGMAEHGGRYSHIAERLASLGYATGIPDLSGHGLSEGRRCHIDDFSSYCDDLRCFHSFIVDGSLRPVFLFGHSMGGLIVLQYALRYQDTLCGLMLCAPCISPAMKVTPFHLMAAELLSYIAPRTGVTRLPAKHLCRDSRIVEHYINDPLVFRGKISARLGTQLVKTGRSLIEYLSEIRVPLLILQGTDDRLCAVEGSKLVYNAVGTADRMLKLYEGFYHEVFNEPENGSVFTDLETWLEGHVYCK